MLIDYRLNQTIVESDDDLGSLAGALGRALEKVGESLIQGIAPFPILGISILTPIIGGPKKP